MMARRSVCLPGGADRLNPTDRPNHEDERNSGGEGGNSYICVQDNLLECRDILNATDAPEFHRAQSTAEAGEAEEAVKKTGPKPRPLLCCRQLLLAVQFEQLELRLHSQRRWGIASLRPR